MPSPKPVRMFRGWIVLAGLFVVLTVSSGFAFYAQGIFLDALVREQGFSVGMAGAGTGTFFVSSGIAGYFAGGLISKYDARSVMTVGAFIGAGGLALIARISTEWQMFPGYGNIRDRFCSNEPGTSLKHCHPMVPPAAFCSPFHSVQWTFSWRYTYKPSDRQCH